MTLITESDVPYTGWADLDESSKRLAATGNGLLVLMDCPKPACAEMRAQLSLFLELGHRHIQYEESYLRYSGNHRAAWRTRYLNSLLSQISQELSTCGKGRIDQSRTVLSCLVQNWLEEHFFNCPYTGPQGKFELDGDRLPRLNA